MKGFHFTKFDPDEGGKSKFQQLLDLFMQLLTYTSGDVGEAMQWMNELDKQYKLTNDEYGMGDFIGAWRSSAPQRTAACRLKPSISAHSVCLKPASLGITPCTVSTFCPARGPKAMR